MKVLVTGATGFLGHHIAKMLKDQGHDVFNFSRSHNSELDEISVQTIKGDLADKAAIEKSLEGIEAVFHVASKVGMWGKWEDFYNINYLGTKNLVDACKAQGIKTFVYTSTPSVVFGKDSIENGNESTPYPKEYLSLYAKSKALAEEYVLSTNDEDFKVCAIRPHLIYGERDKNIIPRLVDAQSKGKLKAVGNRDNLVDIIYVENAAQAHIDAFNELLDEQKNAGKAYFIGQERPVNLWEFIDQILECKGLGPVKKSISLSKAYKIGHIVEIFLKSFRIFNVHPPMTRFVALQFGTSHYFSHANAKNDFGYTPKVTIEESLQRLR
jgi:nucleoside-diphosphate-sugar epimerase